MSLLQDTVRQILVEGGIQRMCIDGDFDYYVGNTLVAAGFARSP